MKGGHGMSRKCALTGKGPLSGNRRSNSMRATKHTQKVNLQKVKVTIDGKPQTVKMSTRALRTLKAEQ